MTDSQAWARAFALIRRACANYDGPTGECLPLDCACPQLHSRGSLLCKYFRRSVLPMDGPLQWHLTGGAEGMKRCAACGDAFAATSNRAKYCPACRGAERKKREAERQRARRAGKQG